MNSQVKGLTLQEIQAPVSEQLSHFEKLYIDSLKSDNEYIAAIIDYIIRNKGKQLRPLLILLVSALNGGITQKSIISAILIEIVHTSSLVHDDVVDEAYQRRGRFSVNALWRSRTAVLMGDYLLSRGLSIAANNDCNDVLKILLSCIEELCEGELIQMEHAEHLDITEDVYYDIVGKKTATLMRACGLAGAISAGASEENVRKMGEFAWMLGIAFQIKDDILDYIGGAEIGKPLCADLTERKITLPLLYVINNSTKAAQKEIFRKISNIRIDKSNIYTLRNMVVEHGGIDYSIKMMNDYQNSALELINDFPDSEYKKSLFGYADFILNRNK